MAYSGFISDPDYARKSLDETVTGKWVFEDEINFKKVIRGTAHAAYYADLAEYYEYEFKELIPQGTLVKIGGQKEITKTSKDDRNVFGVISTNPGLILNEKSTDTHLPVALIGRVPCRVRGTLKKGDKITTSKIPGVAKKKTILDKLLGKPTVGLSLEDKKEFKEKLVEIFIRPTLI